MATISANNDHELGSLIADLFDRVGPNGAITVEEGRTMKHEIEFVEGLKFDRGFMSPYFANNSKNTVCEMENPLVLLANTKVSTLQQIYKYLEYASQQSKSLLIIAEDIESEPLATLILNKLKGSLRVCCVKAPAFGDNRKNQLNDMAILLGGTVVDTEIGMSLENQEIDILGSCKKVIVNKDDSIILGGQGAEESIKKRI